ncbi:hypothetical protein EDB83DRAFT_2526321 [Lactarius deliciosus]|nr:hypothetical protein EDB83DRAFT_2526321 [Lactarius deliciosus]
MSAPDLVEVELRDIPPTGYFPPETMTASLAVLPRLRSLTIGFEAGVSYPDGMRLPPNTRAVLLALTKFFFSGLFEYFENLIAQIDAPQLNCFRIEYLNQYGITDFRIPQLCKFIDRSEKLKSSQFIRADLLIEPSTVVIELVHRDRSRFHLFVQEDAIGQVVSQISAILSNVDRLFISSDFDEIVGNGIRWLEVFRPFTCVKALSVDGRLSRRAVHPALNNVTERAAEVLPALELLYLENHLVTSVKNFVAARQNTGRPVTVINEGKEFHERLNLLMSANRCIFRTH